jgi:ABC-type dipeptide/oligopeptide/nickel transport system permease component
VRRVLRYTRRRLVSLPISLAVVATLAFLLVNVLPGNPAGVIAGPAASEEQIATIEERLRLNDPLIERYGSFMGDLVQWDLGTSYYTNRPVTEEIGRFLPNTLELVVMSLVVAAVVGLALGTIAAYFAGRAADRVARLIVTVSQSVPDFFLALLLIYFGFYIFGAAPGPVGRLGLLESRPDRITGALILDSALAGEWSTFRSALQHSALPVLTLGFYYSSYFAKTTISSLLPALESKQVEFARAAGLRERTVLAYAFRQARTPILTYGGILLAALTGGAAIVETIFSWGGFGEWAIDSILQLDIPAVQGFIVVAGIGTLLIFTLLDVLVAALDPRVSYD